MAVDTSAWRDPRYQEAAQHVQEGAWKAALEKLRDLQTDYPDYAEIQFLIESTQMKVDLEQKPVSGRSPIMVALTQRRRLAYMAVAVLVIAVLVGGWYGYRRWVEPMQLIQRFQNELANALTQAELALAQGAYDEAVPLFEKVLQMEPQNASALAGLNESQRQIRLNEQYEEAVSVQNSGDTTAALALYNELLMQESDYKDVPERVADIRSLTQVHDLFTEADSAYQDRNWSNAILLYNQIREQSAVYEPATVEQHLFDSYNQSANDQLAQSGLSLPQVDQIAELYRRALSLRPRDALVQGTLDLISVYQQGKAFMAVQQFNQSIPLLLNLYISAPNFLGGDGVQALFDSYVGYGAQFEADGDLPNALVQYNAAASLPVANAIEAKLRARKVEMAMLPTPTPTPTITPTPTPDPFEAIIGMIEPTPSPIEQFTGWIAFKSDRPGSRSGFWVMRPDGSEQTPVNDPTGIYNTLKIQATWSPDNQQRIWVEDDGSGKSVAIYMWRYDVPAHWRDARVELLNNSAINYQVAYSPNGESVVFTSQRGSGPPDHAIGLWGDEIFIFHFADFNSSGYVTPIRLTNNDWEWDKHPTFSPDGQTIAFWSNRISGRAQIWAMNADGTSQRNLSNNEWNDWDPVWILPRREVPVLKDQNSVELFDPDKYQAEQ
ncbi:MAG: hypothetical protein R2856_06405 [Caldilineaceae bacterium]